MSHVREAAAALEWRRLSLRRSERERDREREREREREGRERQRGERERGERGEREEKERAASLSSEFWPENWPGCQIERSYV